MGAHRRSLVTAAVAGGLLCGLWFVPSANATDDSGAPAGSAAQVRTEDRTRPQAGPETASPSGAGVELADTGSFDATPYLVGGFGFLGMGAALVTHARIRSVRGAVGVRPVVR